MKIKKLEGKKILDMASINLDWVTAIQSFFQNPEADLIFLASSLTSFINSSITESVILELELVLVALAMRIRIQVYSMMAKKDKEDADNSKGVKIVEICSHASLALGIVKGVDNNEKEDNETPKPTWDD